MKPKKFNRTHSLRLTENEPTDCISRVLRVARDAKSGVVAFRFETVWDANEDAHVTEFMLSPYAIGMFFDAIKELHLNAEKWKYKKPRKPKSPHPIVTQPETNLPISGLGGYDQVLRDEFEDGKK